MKGNAWLAGYFVFTAALLGGAGFFFMKGRGAYDEQFNGWDSLKGKIARFEKEVPYPNKDNEETLQGLVTDYDAKVKELYDSLVRYQKPLNEQLSDNEFTNQVLKNKVSAFLKLASERKVEVDKKEEFYFGFNDYQTTFPRPQIVPVLNFQLEAVEHLLNSMVDAGVERLRELNREQLPGEQATDDPKAAVGIVAGQVVQKYPISVRFVGTHRSFEEFVNRLANDKEYFFILRTLRVDNSNPEGPLIGSGETAGGSESSLPTFKNAAGATATREEMEAKGLATLPWDDFMSAMAADGWLVQKQDARIIFGQEKLDVFAVIDLVRFLAPDEVEAPAAEAKGPAKGTRR